jgi:hypothetical protein
VIQIDGYIIDASLSESHTFESEVTDYPVESGASITDNVRPKPIVVSIEGVVSDSPIGPVATARNNETASPDAELQFLPSEAALDKLLRIRDAREPITIVTSLKTFESMVLTNLDVPRDADTGHALKFTASFQQVILVTNNRTTVKVSPPTSTGLGKKKDLGPKNGITYDTKAGAVIWHHSTPLPRWSTSEILGYNAKDVREKGTSGLYHLPPPGGNGQPLTQEELDDFNADDKAWFKEHDKNGNLKPEPLAAGQPNVANNANTNGVHSTEPVFKQGDGQWVDEAGAPVAYNPTYGTWYETAPGPATIGGIPTGF